MNICCLAFFGQDPRCAALAKSHTSRVEALSLKDQRVQKFEQGDMSICAEEARGV